MTNSNLERCLKPEPQNAVFGIERSLSLVWKKPEIKSNLERNFADVRLDFSSSKAGMTYCRGLVCSLRLLKLMTRRKLSSFFRTRTGGLEYSESDGRITPCVRSLSMHLSNAWRWSTLSFWYAGTETGGASAVSMSIRTSALQPSMPSNEKHSMLSSIVFATCALSSAGTCDNSCSLMTSADAPVSGMPKTASSQASSVEAKNAAISAVTKRPRSMARSSWKTNFPAATSIALL